MKKVIVFVVIIAGLACKQSNFAVPPPSAAHPFIVDTSSQNKLRPGQIDTINSRLQEYFETAGVRITFLLIDEIPEGVSGESYKNAVFKKWNLHADDFTTLIIFSKIDKTILLHTGIDSFVESPAAAEKIGKSLGWGDYYSVINFEIDEIQEQIEAKKSLDKMLKTKT